MPNAEPVPSAPPRIYLAGPEVFLPDPVAAGAAKQKLCEAAGFIGVFPLDAELKLEKLERGDQARRISLSNEELIRSCDLLIANLTPFRGVSADAGTVFEVGFMRALGRPVLGYTNANADFRSRSLDHRAGQRLAYDGDREDVEIEDFGLAENLMIEIAIQSSGSHLIRSNADLHGRLDDLRGFKQCLLEARRLFQR